ncbi:hypothetical protein [Parahaliea mediterranea]|uniref:hypothetical protein n=1 Tax=Parahaliea mediterranea TaxID=651086 RepID=UPI000E2ECB3F|nr:hypothetical protein [Parahaliea mediterranea]
MADTNQVDLKMFQEDFPEVYNAMEQLMVQRTNELSGKLDSQLAELREPITRLQQQEMAEYRATQLAAFSAVHPDYQTIQKDPAFWAWVDQQGDGVKSMVRSTAASDNVALLNIYKASDAYRPGNNSNRHPNNGQPMSPAQAAKVADSLWEEACQLVDQDTRAFGVPADTMTGY